MAIVDINTNTNVTYIGTDTVTWFTVTFTGSNSVQKLDILAMNVFINVGALITFSGSSFFITKGSRGNFVDHDTNGTKVKNSWTRFEITSDSTLFELSWSTFSNCGRGFRLNTNSNFSSGTWHHNIFYNCSTNLDINAASGVQVLQDTAFIKTLGVAKTGTSTTTLERCTFLEQNALALGVMSRSMTLTDIYLESASHLRLVPVSGDTHTITRLTRKFLGGIGGATWATPAGGTNNVFDSKFVGGARAWRQSGTGESNMVRCDFGDGFASEGVLGAGIVNLTDCCLYANRLSAISVIDLSIAVPNSSSTPSQYIGVASVTTPASARNTDIIISSVVVDVGTDNKFRVTFTTDIEAKAKILISKIQGDYSDGVVVASDWDAPAIFFRNKKIESKVTDWALTGKTYDFSHDITIPNVEAGEYRLRIICESILDEQFEEPESLTTFEVTSAVVADPDPPTWDTTTGVQTLVGLGSSLTADWGNASDLLSPPVQYNVYIRPNQAPDSFGPASPYLLKRVRELQTTIFTEANNVTLLDKNTTYHVVVRAVDNQGNEETNIISLSTTPALSPIAGNSLQGVIKIIQDRWSTLIEVAEGLPTSYQNVPFTKPADSIWCELQVRPGIGRPTAIGGVTRIRRRVTGLVFVQIFFPLFLTTNEGWLTADKIVAAFSELSDRKITFQTPSTDDAGASDEHPGFWQINVSCPWFTDSINN